ncbi:TauD/TfdA family dioxygenase [Spartinivicinus ruber]|uniref:TauD/TfdA family dioxygenase n=1 Tax=Spartinivicinus ruber TaxID=2683272 RepID=UPI0013D76902|nr:TauD/TfdA family dioxygenase [Spartinivicinus ruber]
MQIDQFKKTPIKPRPAQPAVIDKNKYIDASTGFVSIVEAPDQDMVLSDYIQSQASELNKLLLETGGILFRGFPVRKALDFQAAVNAFGNPTLPYFERAAVRKEVVTGVFTSTEFSPTVWVDLHHEMSFARCIPAQIFFYADTIAETGGETPVADEYRSTAMIDEAVKREFLKRGLRYTRNFRPDVDMDWRSAFQTDDREKVAEYCRENAIEWRWLGEEHLQTIQQQAAFVRDPQTSELLFCNHAHIFHPAAMPTPLREALTETYGAGNLPRNVTFGDGATIPDETILHLREVYQKSTLLFPWLSGDVLLLNNIRCLHGRAPFTGSRTTLVSMTGLIERNI